MTPPIQSLDMPDLSGTAASHSVSTQQFQTDMLSHRRASPTEEQARPESANVLPISPSATSTKQRPGLLNPRSRIQACASLPETQSPKQGDCQCFQTTLVLLEGFENRASTLGTQSIDSILAYQKKALNHCTHMVRCPACAARSDYMVLLGVVSDKLITSYEQVIARNTENLLKPPFSNQHHGDQNSEDGRRLGTCTPFSSPSDGGGAALAACAVTFGCYKIEGHKEWDFVVRVLIALQLQQVASLLAHMQVIAERMSREPQLAALRMRKQRLKLATEKVRKFP